MLCWFVLAKWLGWSGARTFILALHLGAGPKLLGWPVAQQEVTRTGTSTHRTEHGPPHKPVKAVSVTPF